MNIKKLKRFCPICGNDSGRMLGNVEMALGKNIKLSNHYNIVSCLGCGFSFADTQSNQEDYNAYYAGDNCYSDDGEIKSTSMKQSVGYSTQFFSKYVKKNETILDIGCGSGDFLIALKDMGYEKLCGLDPSQASIDRLEKAGIKGIKKNIFDICEDEEKFDVIVSTCVLEHICDLEGYFRISLSHLREGGKIFVVVPAVEGFERYYQCKANYFNHEHINYFSKISLTNLLGKHGCVSLDGNKGVFYVIEQSSGAKDMMLQNIFCYESDVEYEQQRDDVSQTSIINFLSEYHKEECRIIDLTENLSKKNKKCIVWGAGSLSMQLMTNAQFAEKVEFFIDNNREKIGKDIAGKMIYSPDILNKECYQDLILLVVCMQFSDNIVQQIKEMQVENEIIVF